MPLGPDEKKNPLPGRLLGATCLRVAAVVSPPQIPCIQTHFKTRIKNIVPS
jgi:hypothetical protein